MLQFFDKHRKFSTEKIMDAQNFNFVSKGFKMEVLALNFAFLDEVFRQEKNSR